MEKVRFGIIGIGNIGTVHARYLLAGTVSDACLAAVCDNALEKHPAIRQIVGTLPLFSDAQEMLQSGLIDAVIVATPHLSIPDCRCWQCATVFILCVKNLRGYIPRRYRR